MRINTNVSALNSYNQLKQTNQNMNKSLERLSSGKRINRAADDAAGLAISEKMKAQMEGLGQAQSNAQNGISMIQTAEGALNETHSILQRMRELSAQAANGTNTDADRQAIQDEISQLQDEVDRIGETTEFNTQKLLQGDTENNIELEATGVSDVDGELSDGSVTTSEASQMVTLTGYDDSTNGSVTTSEASQMVTLTGYDDSTNGTDATGFADGEKVDELTLSPNGNDITVNIVEDTDLATGSTSVSSATSTAVTISINADGTDTISSADIASDVKTGLEGMIDSNETLDGNYETTASASNVTLSATDDGEFAGEDGYMAEVDNTTILTAGVSATTGDTTEYHAGKSIDFSGVSDISNLVDKGMTINDQQIEFYDADDGAYSGDAIGVDISDAIGNGAQSLASAMETQLGSKLEGVEIKQGDSTDMYGEDTGNTVANTGIAIIAEEPGKAGNGIEVKDGAMRQNFKSQFQIGSNSDQTMSVEIKDMRSEALGVDSIDVTSQEGAEDALDTLDSAISEVSSQRSNLGAVQNRLNHTINNLSTAEENLTAANSRVRDADMASEMMQMSKQRILRQAGTAMMAQANQKPQGVMQLLG